MKPKDVKSYLDRFVMEQDECSELRSVALCDHYNWARRCLDQPDLREKNYMKPNILISGPTGSGKTYLVRTMAKMLGVPFVKADATKFSETGIVGEDAEDVVRQLVDAAGGSSEVAEYGMVYVDEVDKICSSSAGSRGNFLKIMEDTEVSAKNSMQASLSSMFGGGQDDTISTKFVLFIFSGAFTGMNDIIKNRVGYLHLAETKDFIDAGLEPEFIGRVPVRVAIRSLDAEDLYKILALAEDSVLQQFQKDFKGYGIELKAQTDALRRVAELAVEEKTGARALVTVMEKESFAQQSEQLSCVERSGREWQARLAEWQQRLQRVERQIKPFDKEDTLSHLAMGVLKLAQLLGIATEEACEKLGWRDACADLARMVDHTWLRCRLPKKVTVLKLLRQKADAEMVRELQISVEELAALQLKAGGVAPRELTPSPETATQKHLNLMNQLLIQLRKQVAQGAEPIETDDFHTQYAPPKPAGATATRRPTYNGRSYVTAWQSD
ncbi:unnamed protein product [Effrenium voratum]|nr:unnamed protein product [Effrenium voratum]